MLFETSPQSSPSSKPLSIRSMASPSESLFGTYAQDITPSSRGSTCAYPSWPSGNSLSAFRTSAPSAFISDLDLFPDDILDDESGFNAAPLLHEAPAPPRQAPLAQAFPLLPLYASEKSKKRRRSSGRKQRRPSKPMTPISESPEAPE